MRTLNQLVVGDRVKLTNDEPESFVWDDALQDIRRMRVGEIAVVTEVCVPDAYIMYRYNKRSGGFSYPSEQRLLFEQIELVENPKLKVGDRVRVCLLHVVNELVKTASIFDPQHNAQRPVQIGDEMVVEEVREDTQTFLYKTLGRSGISTYYFLISDVEVVAAPAITICTCSKRELMMQGCKCGYLAAQRKAAKC